MTQHQYSAPFLEFCLQANLAGPQEVSINSLLTNLELTENALDGIAMLNKGFSQFGLEITPSFQEGSLDQVRILRVAQKTKSFDIKVLQGIIEEGENFNNEFKSTLLLDVNKKKFYPQATVAELKSEEVIYTALKTVAGFLNWGGGKLLIGVENDGNCLGIEQDYIFFKSHEQNQDHWELDFRNLIIGRFHEGNTVNQHINVSFVLINNVTVAVIEVFPRRKLSFLRKNPQSDYLLYTRQGNSTRQVQIFECEEYIEVRKGNLKYS